MHDNPKEDLEENGLNSPKEDPKKNVDYTISDDDNNDWSDDELSYMLDSCFWTSVWKLIWHVGKSILCACDVKFY